MDDWTPAYHERAWYRHVITGDLGFIVRRHGKDCIRMDHGDAPEDIRDYHAEQWIQESVHHPMVRPQLAQVAFEADKKLCFFLGLHKESKKDWRMLREEDRIAWTEKGPRASELRNHLWASIMGALKDLAK